MMKCGYVVILGRPNVGKSTLLNHLIGEKLAGVSPKPQTTRVCVRGILTQPQGQIIFLDTPGLHEPRDLLGNRMIAEAEKFLPDADLLYWMVLPEPPRREDEKVLELVRGLKIPVVLVINQVDRFPKPAILPVIQHYQSQFNFTEIIPISAKLGIQTDVLVKKTLELLPEGPFLFPEDQISDQNERFIAREIIAEKLFLFTGQEIPYSTAVVIEDFKERNEKLVDIQATIIVEKDSQKAIIIGERGQKMKEIGQSARLGIEKFLGKKVFLQLWVKTMPHWKRDKAALKRLGYD